MKFSLLFIFFVGFLIVLFPSDTLAATLTLTDINTSSITDSNQELTTQVTFSIDAPDSTVYYLRGVFYKAGSTNYCGFTWNGNTWFSGPYSSGSGWKNFLPISIASGSAATLLRVKPDSTDSGCKESGEYKFKVQRFTQSGSSTFDQQDAQTVMIQLPTPTTSPPTPSPTKIPTKSASSQLNTKSVSILPTSTTPHKNLPPTVQNKEDEVTTVAGLPLTAVFLGEKILAATNDTDKKKEILVASDREQIPLPLILALLLGAGGSFTVAAVFALKKIRKSSS